MSLSLKDKIQQQRVSITIVIIDNTTIKLITVPFSFKLNSQSLKRMISITLNSSYIKKSMDFQNPYHL